MFARHRSAADARSLFISCRALGFCTVRRRILEANNPTPSGIVLNFFVLLFLCFELTLSFAQGQQSVLRQQQAVAEEDVHEHDGTNSRKASLENDNPRASDEWFRSGRRALGEHAADLLHRGYQQKKAMAAAEAGARDLKVQQGTANVTQDTAAPSQNTANGIPFNGGTYSGNWKNLGPAPIASDPNQDYGAVVGRVTSVAVDQGDTSGNTVYIGAAFGGAWKSTNAANANPTQVTWSPIIDNQPTLAVGAITVQPGHSNVVLVGTGEPNSSGDSYYGMGILRSTDGGSTWNLIRTTGDGTKTFSGLGASSFAWGASGTANTVVVGIGSTNGTHVGTPAVGGGRGIYYSQDAGATWSYASVKDPSGQTLSEGTVTSIVFNPGTQKFYAAYRYHGFYESSDGVNWIRSTNQPDATGTNLTVANCPTNQSGGIATGCHLYRAQLAVQPVTHDMYVVYVDGNDISQGVYTASVVTNQNPPVLSAWRQLSSQGSGQSGVSTSPIVDNTSTNEIVQGDYDLWIGAVPNGNNTDVLIGTRNIYKCTVAAGQDCGGWQNLTFVYQCNPTAAPSHMHPDQHGFDFSTANPVRQYFGNDGGVYRALNGTSSSIGACNSPNPFDNLDTNMGSLSEMVSFSQHPTNANILLGGLQDNGSPALLNSTNSLWQIVNGGDGGYNEIDPNHPDNIWYTTNTGVSIQQCNTAATGIGITSTLQCTPGTFGAPPYPSQTNNIGPAQVQQDTAEFYMPFTLDPNKTANVVLGTCRIWRGPGDGGQDWVSNAASGPLFDTSASSTVCKDGSTKIRALAAGGALGANGASKVIYAGLEGADTGFDSGGLLGHVFVNTNADTNLASGWVDVTANINPGTGGGFNNGGFGPFPISDIEIDFHDATGQTAYLTVEGFQGVQGTGHVFKTTNAGTSWTDLTHNLPDVPTDSIAIDPDSANTLYVGTDVGAFISTDGGATWQILGTQLPNVPVTKIRVFSSGASKRVRVSTYGRGLWEFTVSASTPVLQSITVVPPAASVPAGQTQAFTATGHYSDNSTQDLTSAVTWTSSDPTIANINTSGVATGVKAGGPVTITAQQGSVKGMAQLTVTAAVLQSITVSPVTASVAAGLTQQFIATGNYSDNSTQDLTNSVSWTSSDNSIATISTTGLATSVKASGPIVIKATQGSVFGTAQLTVTAAVLQSITVSPGTASVAAGLTQQFTATGNYSDNSAQDLTNSVSWTSSDNTIATISTTGLATGVKTGGSVTIKATQGSIFGTAQLTVTAAVLQSITMSPGTASVAAGLTQPFTATGRYSDNSTQDLTNSVSWTSSDNSIATISTTGHATGVKAGGPVTIKATQGSIFGTAQLTVTAAVLESITVSPGTASVAAGLTQPFTATGHYSDNSTQDLTNSVSWTSSDNTIATISTTGLATGVKTGGPVTIKATQGSIFGTAQLTVTAAVLQSITVSPGTASVAAGLTQQFTATGNYSDNSAQDLTNSVSWTSSDNSIATISTTGLATGVKAGGPVTITSQQGSVKGTAQLTVTAAVLQSITLSPGTASVAAGLTQPFTATGRYSDNSTQDLTNSVSWTSSDNSIATISTTGLATGVKTGGPVTIKATQGSIFGTAQLTVTAAVLQSITMSPGTASVAAGLTQPFTATGRYSDNSTQDLTNSVSWTSSDNSIATISTTGHATGVKAGGPVTIKATQGSIFGTAQLTVTAAVLESMTVSPGTASVAAGLTQSFTATGHYSDNSTQDLTGTVTWASSDTTIATISTSGVATGVKAGGPMTISAQQGSVKGTAQLTVIANNVSVTVNTLPAGETFSVDGATYSTAQTFTWASGSTHTIGTTSPHAGSPGTQFSWLSWSDGGGISHQVTAPNSAVTYTANFSTQFQLLTNASPIAGGSVTPASGNYYNAGTVVNLTATANAGFTFAGWTGSVANPSSAATTVTMNTAQTVTATFITNPTLTVSTFGPGSGSIISSPAGVSCIGSCSANFISGTSVTLTATAAAGSTFVKWNGCDSVAGNSCTVVMNSSRSIMAGITQLSSDPAQNILDPDLGMYVSLKYWMSHGGEGPPPPPPSDHAGNNQRVPAIQSPLTNSARVPAEGTAHIPSRTTAGRLTSEPAKVSTSLQASHPPSMPESARGGAAIITPDTSSMASESSASQTTNSVDVGGSSPEASRRDIDMSNAVVNTRQSATSGPSVQSTTHTLVVTKSGKGMGEVSSTPVGIEGLGKRSMARYADGTLIKLTAKPGANSTFGSWSGCDVVSKNTCSVVMNSQRSVVATFLDVTGRISGSMHSAK